MADDNNVALTALVFDAKSAKSGAEDFKKAGEFAIATNQAVAKSEEATAAAVEKAGERKTRARKKASQDTVAATGEEADAIEKATKRQALSYSSIERTLQAAARRYDPLVGKAADLRREMAKFDDIAGRALTGSDQSVRAAALAAAAKTRLIEVETAMVRTVKTSDGVSGAVKLQSYQWANLSQQLQDVGVQLAGGQNPFLIAAQQGPQAAYAVGGFSNAFALLGGVIKAHPILAIVSTIAAAAGAFLFLRNSTKEATEATIDHAAAMEKANELLATSEERAIRAATEKRRDAAQDLKNSQDLRRKELEDINKQITLSEALAEKMRTTLAADTSPLGNPELEAMLKAETDQLVRLKTEAFELGGVMGQTADKLERFAVIARGVPGDDANAALKDFNSLFSDAGKVIEKAQGPLEAYATELVRLQAMKQFDAIGPETFAKAVQNLNAWLWENSAAAKAATEEGKRLFDVWKQTEKVMAEAEAADEKLAEQFRTKSATAVETYRERVDDLNRLFKREKLTPNEYGRSVENLNQWLQEQDPAFQTARKAAEEYSKEIGRLSERTADRLTDFAGDALFDRMTGKAANFWERSNAGKRAIAQVAAEAFVRPIALRLATPVIGLPMTFIPDAEAE